MLMIIFIVRVYLSPKETHEVGEARLFNIIHFLLLTATSKKMLIQTIEVTSYTSLVMEVTSNTYYWHIQLLRKAQELECTTDTLISAISLYHYNITTTKPSPL